MKPCLRCGEPTEGTRCSAHSAPARPTPRRRVDTTKTSWKNLSIRVRKAQPFCTICGDDRMLQADHSPRAWARMEQRLPVRDLDVTVLCGPCNLAAGSSQPGSARYKRWELEDGDLRSRAPDETLDLWGVEVAGKGPLTPFKPRARLVLRTLRDKGAQDG